MGNCFLYSLDIFVFPIFYIICTPFTIFYFAFLFFFILLQLSQFFPFLRPAQPLLPQSIPTPLSMSVGHSCSLTNPAPFFPPFSSLPFPLAACQSVPCFHGSGSILLLSLLCSSDSSYK